MRFSFGTSVQVSQTDTWLQLIRNANGFASGVALGASLGNFNEVQLLNPTGSGILVVVRRIIAARTAAGSMTIRRYDTALANGPATPANRLLGGAPAIAQLRYAQVTPIDGTIIQQMFLPAQTPFSLTDLWGWALPAGTGMLVVDETVNEGTQVMFDWAELAR